METPIGKFSGKIKIWSTHISFVGNLQLPVGKVQLLSARPAFLTHEAAACTAVEWHVLDVQEYDVVPCTLSCDEYDWQTGDWSVCTTLTAAVSDVHCGPGLQSRSVRSVTLCAQTPLASTCCAFVAARGSDGSIVFSIVAKFCQHDNTIVCSSSLPVFKSSLKNIDLTYTLFGKM